MAEQFRSITEARKELPSLSQTVQGGGDRYVITNQGKPQAVLLGYGDYKGLMAAVELLNRPKDLAHLQEGLEQEQRLNFEELKEGLRRRKGAQSEVTPALPVKEPAKPVSMESIGKRLDEINENLEQITVRLGVVEPEKLLGEEFLRSAKDEMETVETAIRREVLRNILAGGLVKIELLEPAVGGVRRKRGAAIRATVAAETEMDAEG